MRRAAKSILELSAEIGTVIPAFGLSGHCRQPHVGTSTAADLKRGLRLPNQGKTTMKIEGVPYSLRTTAGTEGVGYNTLDRTKAALKTLIALEVERGNSVVEQTDHKWISHQNPHDSVLMWIETEMPWADPLRCFRPTIAPYRMKLRMIPTAVMRSSLGGFATCND
jgi:hypothetical protein